MSEPSSNPIPKTLFIIGAGASKEVGLPIGSELKNFIAVALNIQRKAFQKTTGDALIVEALTVAYHDHLNEYMQAAQHIYDAMPQASSIDDFIDSQRGNKHIELCGKLAIVQTILEAEANSNLFVGFQGTHPLEFERFVGTWFYEFVQMLITGCPFSDLEARLKSVAFIIFNYDRCVEHYLYHAIQRYYSVSADAAARALKCLEIYHPYGTVGSLPWLSTNNAIEFGARPRSAGLLALAGQIRTFTEVTGESSSDVNSIRETIKFSRTLIFLGFAFHHMNIELLLPQKISGERRIFATALRMSRSNTDFITAELASRLSLAESYIQIHDLTCGGLIQEHRHKLSFNR